MCRASLPTALALLALCCALGGSATPASATGIRLSRLSLEGVPQHNETLGYPRAPVKMVYFNDPKCPICLEWQQKVLPALVRKYARTGRLQIQWQGIVVEGFRPTSLFGERFIAASGLQNHLWDVLDDVMANQRGENSDWLNESLLEEVGAVIPGFNVAAAMAAASSRTIQRELESAERLFERYRQTGVPAILVGPRRGPLRVLEASSYTRAEYETAINRLLPKRHR
jgi:protein-disulfide isomerase